jgi:hypothetical protein
VPSAPADAADPEAAVRAQQRILSARSPAELGFAARVVSEYQDAHPLDVATTRELQAGLDAARIRLQAEEIESLEELEESEEAWRLRSATAPDWLVNDDERFFAVESLLRATRWELASPSDARRLVRLRAALKLAWDELRSPSYGNRDARR